jgi:LAO/AO transport system kinase
VGIEAPPVFTYSALAGSGIAELWQTILAHRERLDATGQLMQKRRAQQVRWMWTLIEERFRERLRTDPKVKARLPALEAAVADGKLPPALAAEQIADLLGL